MSFNSALTSGNYDGLRGTTFVSPSHRARLCISLCPNTNIYTARVNQTIFGSSFAQITYGSGSGTLANVRVGMTVLISHTSDRAEAFFVGRIRSAPTSTVFYINETSAPVANDDYIFVLNDFRLFDKLARYASSTLYPDYDVSFRQLLPRIYGLRSGYAGMISGGVLTLSLAPTVAAATDGATISSYLWAVDDGTITVGNSTTKDITVTFPYGFRWIHFTATDSGGRASTRHIPVWAHDDTSYPVTLLEHGDLQVNATVEDGYSGSISAWDSIDTVLDNTLVCAWLNSETYNGTQTNIVNNIVLVGRLRTEASQTEYGDGQQDAETRFEIEGPLQQLARLEITPLQLDNNASPTKFNQIKTMTVWREIHLILTEYSTFHELHSLDFDDTTTSFQEKAIVTQQGNLLSVVNALANGINAALQMSAAGEAEVVRDGVMIPTASRSSLVTVANWGTQDLLGISEGHSHVRSVGRLDASGGTYNTTSTQVAPALSLAPGVAQDYPEGSSSLQNQILAINQTLAAAESELNIRAGHALAKAQGSDELTIAHPDGYWWLTPSLNQWYTWTLDGSETARGLVLTTDTRWQLVSVTVTHEIQTGARTVEATYRKETSGAAAQAIRYPAQSAAPLTLPKYPPLPVFPLFDTGPSFYLPDAPSMSQVPATLTGGTMWTTPLHDGNCVLVWSSTQVWVCNDFIKNPKPKWVEITPEIGPTDTIVQCKFIPTSPPGVLVAVNGGEWTHTIDFTEAGSTAEGFVNETASFWSPSTLGSFASGTGWTATLANKVSSPGEYAKKIAVKLDFGRIIKLTGADVVMWSPNPVPTLVGIIIADPPFGSGQNAADIINQWTVISAGSQTYTWNGEASTDGLIVEAEYSNGGGSENQTFTAEIFEGITFRGIGYNPFDPTNSTGPRVFYAANVFNSEVRWSEGEAVVASELSLMRIGSTRSNVYLFDALAGNAYYSGDYGASVGAAITVGTPPASDAGFDTQRIGTVSLAGMDGKVRRATTQGGAYADYGSALPASARPTALLIPRYTFAGGNNGSGVSNVDYLMASDTLSGAGDALWKVTASGATFDAIGPTDSGNKGLAVGPNCLAMPWISTGYQDVVAVLSFAGTRKLARTLSLGVSWALSAALHASSDFVTLRRTDTLRKQAFVNLGPDLGFTSNYQASPPVLSTRTGPGSSTILGIDVLP